MTPMQIQTELNAIAVMVGPKAATRISINEGHHRDKPIYASLYPFGVGSQSQDGYLSFYAETFEEAITGLRDKWAAYEAEHRSKNIKKMALEIIRITADLGECSDAALREEFDAGLIARIGDEACALADKMAGNGPFKIKKKRCANAA